MSGGVCPQYPNQLCDTPLYTGLVNLGSSFLHSVDCYTTSPNHRHAPASSLEVGQKLWLCLRCSFLCKNPEISPFIIQTIIDPVAARSNCLDLYVSVQTFQVSKVQLVHESPLVPAALPPCLIDSDPAYSLRSGLREMGQRRRIESCLDCLL